MVDAARNTAWDLGKQPNNYQNNYPTQEWARRRCMKYIPEVCVSHGEGGIKCGAVNREVNSRVGKYNKHLHSGKVQELDETINLDESEEWIPSENYSDDDSIHIVAERVRARPVRRCTRASSKATSPSPVENVIMIHSDEESELPNLDLPQIQHKSTAASLKLESTQVPEARKETSMTGKRVSSTSSTTNNATNKKARTSLMRYATHGPPLGVDVLTQDQEELKPRRKRGEKRKSREDACSAAASQPGVGTTPQNNKKCTVSLTSGHSDNFVRLCDDEIGTKFSAKKTKISFLRSRRGVGSIMDNTMNNDVSGVESTPASHLERCSRMSMFKTEDSTTLEKSCVKKGIDLDIVCESTVTKCELDEVKEEVTDDEQKPVFPLLSTAKRENVNSASSLKKSLLTKFEASTMSLECSTSSEFSPVKEERVVPAKKTIEKKSTLASKKVKVSQVDIPYNWDPADVISLRQGIARNQAKEIIKLVDQECTLPFIARYRREKTGNLDINKLREVLNSYEQLKEVKDKVSKLVQGDLKKLAPETRECLLKATSLQEVKTLTASLKTSGNKTYADRARKLGLGDAAEMLLNDSNVAFTRDWMQSLVVPGKEGLNSVEQVETGIKFIFADIISKNSKVIDHMKTWLKRQDVMLKSYMSRKATSQVNESSKKPKKVIAKRKSLGGKGVAKKSTSSFSAASISKYEKYFSFSMPAWRVYSHAVCAINRGEQQGILTVKVLLPSFTYDEFVKCVSDLYLLPVHIPGRGYQWSYRHHLIQNTLPDCWERLVLPSLQSWVRSELNDSAELASIKVFVTNVRHLLLTPPVRARTVLAIDPGFHKGCKVAVVERKGKVLAVETIHPFTNSMTTGAAETLSKLVCEYCCEIIAIGNGTACRETEAWLSKLIHRGSFPGVNVQYTIVNESGASHYSVTDEARAEFPSMDVNHISAVSLARRLQDPLLEYVKVPPMHLGVGMYQHDVSNKLLTTALNSVVMECVSFVGVDLNVASEVILKKVSGLNKARAAAIVKYREEIGPFRDREQLKKVKGIGPVSFQQCAGFVKVVPQTLRQRSNNSNLSPLCPLDSTTVHPESYSYAKKLIDMAALSINNIGSSQFIEDLKAFIKRQPVEETSEKCGCSKHTLETILESLYQPLDFDYRVQFDLPLFRKGITSMSELKLGQHLTGSVMNVTTFGTFVDIGVGHDGLVHKSRMGSYEVHVGNTVEVEVTLLDVPHAKVGLRLVSVVR
ncbi:Tex protein YqgF-like domain [Trinorchestia longiramus]|nr:Tex protein YqgF-like domain [Trinorchestia longiramus]